MNRRLALAALALIALAPLAQAGGKPIPMQEIIDSPFNWMPGKTATLEQAQKAVMGGMSAKGWTPTPAGTGKVHGLLKRDDWRCEVDVTFDTQKFSILYADSDRLDYNAEKKVIHRNFNRWLQLMQQQINIAALNSAG